MNTYTITLTDTQARVLVQATEVLARLGIGQFRDALEHLPTRECAPEGWHDDMAIIGRLLSKHLIDGVDGYSRSLGVHSKDVSETSRVAWDLYQVLRHRLAWEHAVEKGLVESIDSPRKWPEMMQVNYDEPLKVSECPLATIEKGAKHMRIKSEYTILAECVERGVDYGYARAYKHDETPEPLLVRQAIYGAVLSEIAEYFSFDEENYE